MAAAPLATGGSAGAALLTADDLRRLPAPAATPATCVCARLVCPGWESVPEPLAPPLVRCLGTLRAPGDDEPTLAEWPHSRYWAPDAPVSPLHHPYNRCSVWACTGCGRGFVQYTEFGGYYVDHRLRQVDPALVA